MILLPLWRDAALSVCFSVCSDLLPLPSDLWYLELGPASKTQRYHRGQGFSHLSAEQTRGDPAYVAAGR